MHRRGPVAVTVEKRAANTAVENAVECLMVRLGVPFADEVAVLFEAADAKALVIGRTASEAPVVRRVRLLNAFHPRNRMTSAKNARKCRSSSLRESAR